MISSNWVNMLEEVLVSTIFRTVPDFSLGEICFWAGSMTARRTTHEFTNVSMAFTRFLIQEEITTANVGMQRVCSAVME